MVGTGISGAKPNNPNGRSARSDNKLIRFHYINFANICIKYVSKSCARSSTDRMKVCGALDPGSIPGGRTTEKIASAIFSFYKAQQMQFYYMKNMSSST